jgi:hypothetical protein
LHVLLRIGAGGDILRPRFLPVFSAAHHRRSHITNKRRHQRSGAIRGVALGVTPKLVI